VCLVGCEALRVDMQARRCSLGGRVFREGELITLDGRAGDVYAGAVGVVTETPLEYLDEVARWRSELSAQRNSGKETQTAIATP